MAGAKERKGETSSSGPRSGGNGGGGAVCGVNEKGALFPRLDVKETRRDGPRAPPRNKMALYEQFTFPSHRFVPPSLPLPAAARPTVSKTTSYGPQQSSHEMSMRYIPASFGSMPWMPYSAMKTVPQQTMQPSMNCSSSSTVVDGEVDFQQRRGPPANEMARPSSSVTEYESRLASSRSYQSSMSRKTTRYNDDCMVPSYVPQSSSAHGLSRRSGEGSRAGGHQHGVETSSTVQPASASSEIPVDSSSGLGKGRPSQEVYSHSMRTREDKEAERELSSKAGKKDREGESKLKGDVNIRKENDCPSTKKGHSGRPKFQCDSTEQRSSQHHGQPKDTPVEAVSGPDRHKNAAVRGGCLSASENAGEPDALQSEMNLAERRGTERSPGRESPSSKFDERGKSNKETIPSGPKSKKRPSSSACKSNSSAHSDDEMEVASGADAPEQSLSEAWSDGADSDASMAGSKSPKKQRKLTSRDIINSLGEQEFWKTRRMIQRQQQIFESQVFELHRLVQVQKLLALSADASMDDNDTGDPEEKAEGIPEPVQLQEAILEDKAAQDPETQSRDQEMHEDVPIQPESACHSSSAKVCLQPSPGDPPLGYANGGQAPAAPDATQEGSAASWGCSPFPQAADAGNWCAPVVAPNGTYMYDSYPMSFHAPPHHAMGAYGGAYRPVMYSPSPVNVPGMTPYGMPRYDQRPDVVQDMYRYNGYRPQWPPAMFCGPVGSNPGGGWYGVPPTMPYMNQSLRGAYGWYEGMAAGGHPSSTLNGVGHGHLSGMQGMPVPPFVVQPPWVNASNDQQPSCDGDKFQRQMAWGASADSSHMPSLGFRPLERPSGMDSGEPPPPRSNERGLSEVAQTPTQGGFKRLLPRASGRPCSISGLQPAGGGELNFDWGNPEARNFRGHEHRPPQPLLDSQSISPDELEERTSKRSRCDGREGNELEDTDETSSRLEIANPIEGQINALPLFPLAPALHPAEDERTSSRSSEVIKVVPRAMVATAESAAEILMSIQTRRQQ